MKEKDLVLRAKSGDMGAFEELMRLYQARLRGFVARFCQDPDDVFDIVQDGFLEAYRHMGEFDLGRAFFPWIRTICRNKTYSLLRDKRRHPRRAFSPATTEAIAERLVRSRKSADDDDVVEKMSALEWCLGRLQANSRRIVDLRYHKGLSMKQLAADMRKTAPAIAASLRRVRTHLLDCIKRRMRGVRV